MNSNTKGFVKSMSTSAAFSMDSLMNNKKIKKLNTQSKTINAFLIHRKNVLISADRHKVEKLPTG